MHVGGAHVGLAVLEARTHARDHARADADARARANAHAHTNADADARAATEPPRW